VLTSFHAHNSIEAIVCVEVKAEIETTSAVNPCLRKLVTAFGRGNQEQERRSAFQ